MRIGARHLVCLLLTGSLALVACESSFAGEQAEASEATNLHKAFASSFVARLVSPEPGMNAAFIAHLSECYLPVWYELRSEGAVSRVSVFQLSLYDSTATDNTVRHYLVLAELGPQAKPDDLMDAEKASACPERQGKPSFSVLRSAHLSCTPNSCYGMPEPAYQDAASGIDYLVEFIGVEETPSVLAKYRGLMSKYVGPANGILVESGMLHCFIALENVEVLFEAPGVAPWNQIDISDDWDVGGEVDWDSVYVELFRSKFSCDLDSVWAEVPPTDETRADYRGRLIPKLCVR